MEEIDVRVVIAKLARKWPWFLLSLVLTLGATLLFLYAKDEEYLVQSTIQLKEQSLSDKGTTQEKFINGLELVETDPELEDEIGLLASDKVIRQTVQKLGMYTNLYRYKNSLGNLSKNFAREIYGQDFVIRLDTSKPQLIHVPVHITFQNDSTYRVTAEAEGAPLYDYHDQQFAEETQDVAVNQVGIVGQPFKSPHLNFTLEVMPAFKYSGKYQYYFVSRSLDEIAEAYHHNLTVTPIAEKANIVTLKLQGPAARKQINFLNTLTQVYIQNDLLKKGALSTQTVGMIDDQLAHVADTLRRVEGSLKNFRANSQVVDVSTTSEALTEQLNKLEEKQATIQVQNQYYSHLVNYLTANSNNADMAVPSAAGIEDPVLNNLLVELSELNRRKVSVSYNSSNQEGNPVLKVLEEKIAATKNALLGNLQNLLRSSTIALRENDQRIASVKRSLGMLPENERNLNNIERKFKLNDHIYKYLLEKRAEAGIALASNIANKSIIDPARQMGSKPVAPSKTLALIVALIVGLIVPAGFMAITDYLRPVVATEDQVEKSLQLPVLASVVYRKGRANAVTHQYAENAFRTIRHYLQMKEHRLIGVTSMSTAEGKTFSAVNLSISFANSGGKTLLIDTDIYKSDASKRFGLENEKGLTDYLKGKTQQLVCSTTVPNLDVIPAGLQKTDILHVEAFKTLLEKLKQEYQYIVLDTCPAGIINDYLLYVGEMDFTLLVLRNNYTKWNNVKKLHKILTQSGLHDKAAIIYNGITLPKEYYTYYNSRKYIAS